MKVSAHWPSLFVVIYLLLISSCAKAEFELVEKDTLYEFVLGPYGATSSTWRGIFYTGSDSEFDYFINIYGFFGRQKRHFKLNSRTIDIKEKIELTWRKRNWVDVSRQLLQEANDWKGKIKNDPASQP